MDPGSFTGMSLTVKSPAADPNKLTPDSMVNDELPMADVQTSITLPEVMFDKKTPPGKAVKIGFVIYQNDKFFQPVIPDDEENEQETPPVMSRVISSSVQDMTFDNLTKPVQLVFEPAAEVDMDSGECVFWDFSAMGKKLFCFSSPHGLCILQIVKGDPGCKKQTNKKQILQIAFRAS